MARMFSPKGQGVFPPALGRRAKPQTEPVAKVGTNVNPGVHSKRFQGIVRRLIAFGLAMGSFSPTQT
jgi:hypothetical protein